MRIGECSACQFGQHDGHVRNYQPAGEGVIGGAMCPCKGECVERGPSRYIQKELDAIARAFQRVQR